MAVAVWDEDTDRVEFDGRPVRAALEAIAAQVVNVCLAVLFLAIWLGLGAYLDATPSETDAAQASAQAAADALDDARSRARLERIEHTHFATTESQP
jgi:hypothetical protein